MIETLSQLFSRLNVDAKRVGALILFVVALSFLDGVTPLPESLAYLTSIITSTSIVLMVAAVSHVTRRVLFPELDLKEFAKESLGHPVAASVVFLSICIVLTALIVANVMLLA